jgi:hypothetical protein
MERLALKRLIAFLFHSRQVPKGKRIIVEEADALKFCCNAVDLNSHVFMNDASENLQSTTPSGTCSTLPVPAPEIICWFPESTRYPNFWTTSQRAIKVEVTLDGVERISI